MSDKSAIKKIIEFEKILSENEKILEEYGLNKRPKMVDDFLFTLRAFWVIRDMAFTDGWSPKTIDEEFEERMK